jgi:hypothetical protein
LLSLCLPLHTYYCHKDVVGDISHPWYAHQPVKAIAHNITLTRKQQQAYNLYLALSLCQLHEQVATSVCAVGCIKDTHLQLNNGSMVCIHTFCQKLGIKFCSKKNRLLPGGMRKELHTSRMMQYTAHALCTRHVFQISI